MALVVKNLPANAGDFRNAGCSLGHGFQQGRGVGEEWTGNLGLADANHYMPEPSKLGGYGAGWNQTQTQATLSGGLVSLPWAQ